MEYLELQNRFMDRVRFNEPMAKHTTFGVGGPADIFVEPKNEEEICWLVNYAKENGLPWRVLGRGSNVLVRDGGLEGLTIVLGPEFSHMDWAENTVTAEAGVSLIGLSRAAVERSLSGLEFASGIPGSLGGGLMMNAGAYDGEMKNVVRSARILMTDGTIETWDLEKLGLSYRHSDIGDNIVLSATLELIPGDKEAIQAKVADFSARRKDKQPLNYPSAGSAFKRPEGYFAAALIDQAGLKGFHVGAAEVSEKHAGFIVNKGGATAKEIEMLFAEVIRRVQAHSGVTLEPEVRFMGREA